MAVVLFLAMYLGLTWLAILVGIGAFFVILSTIEIHRPTPVPQAAMKQEKEEVLTPVIVQDVGEAPYLYPPDFRLKVKPNWSANDMWENAGWGGALAVRGLMSIFAGQGLAKQRRKY